MGAQLRFIFRLFCLAVGALFLLAGFVVLRYELSRQGEGESVAFQQLGQVWYELDPASLNLAQAIVERYLHAVLWDPVILTLLYWPSVPVLAVPGVLLVLLGLWPRRRRAER